MTKELVAVEKEVCDQLQLLNLDIGDAIILQKEEENSLPKLAPLSDNSTSTAGGADSDTYTSLSKVTTTATTTNTLSSSEENTNLPKVVGFNSLYATNNTDTILLSDNYNDDLMSSGISIDTTTKTTIEIENQNQQQQQQQHYLEVKEEKSCQVRFGDIELKEYGMIMGDHPDTVDGPSVSYVKHQILFCLVYVLGDTFCFSSSNVLHISLPSPPPLVHFAFNFMDTTIV
jgi:hypothetical protein